MKRILYIISALLLLSSCLNLQSGDPYAESLRELKIELKLPSGYESLSLDGVSVEITELNSSAVFKSTCSPEGIALFNVPLGVYSASVSALISDMQFNASLGGIILQQAKSCSLGLIAAQTSPLVFKEIYCGGCSKSPQEGVYHSDAYVILHNNSSDTFYLDSLCFGTLDPYNSNSVSVWGEGIDYAPIIQAIWQFPGSGSSYPLAPGEDAVLVIGGAIDHSSQYPLSVNLNKPDYFAAYNNTYFTNEKQHIAPGDQIRADHILKVVLKLGIASAYTFSINSPAAVVFKAQGQSIEDFLAAEGNITQKPSSSERIAKIPYSWILDGVEVFNGQSSTNKKRLGPAVDASYIVLSNTHESRSLMRRVDSKRSGITGYEVLCDTNSSSADFYERTSQSLKDEK